MTYSEASETLGFSSSAVPPPRLQAGVLLSSRYQLIEDLDPGNPGRSFHAEDITQKRRVRVKTVRCTAEAFAVVREQATLAQKAAHPNFIVVLAAERTGEVGYVVSEWFEGFSLLELLRARRELRLRETLSLLCQMAPAVDAAGELG